MSVIASRSTPTIGLDAADAAAVERMHRVEPVWRGVALARDVIGFDGHTIYHAGPPVDLQRIAQPLLNSAAVAAVFEGWAGDTTQAQEMIRDRRIKLAPAQDHAVMVPLAAVLSPNMFAQVVCDANDPANHAFSPINGGGPHEARFGFGHDRALAHLRWINGNLGAALAIIVDRDIALLPIADRAIAAGDDAHGRTVQASAAVVDALSPRLGVDTPERRFLDAAPGFFLTLWMAACRCIAKAGEGPGSSLITTLGGNGIDFGVQVGAAPGQWITTPAAPPDGPLDAGFLANDRVGAIGDSALVDGLGFGAMLARTNQNAAALLPQPHGGFVASSAAVGLPVRRIGETGVAPRIALGIIERTGTHGRIGGGVYEAPAELFTRAQGSVSGQQQEIG